MIDYKDYFKDKKITVMGLGLLGRGVGDAAFLAECGAEVLVTDLKSKEELAESVAELLQYKNITFRLGEHRDEDFQNRDFILVAAGVPADSKYLSVARMAGIPLRQSAAWFAELSGVPVIGVTGTRGKSTVTAMIHHVLSVVTGEEIILGGNIRGVSNLQLLKQVKEDSLCVMELDSWQLQGWGWAEMSPQVAVFANFMEDHQNYYHSMDDYFNDKAQIFLHQEESGTLVTTPEVFARIKTLSGSLGQEVVLADASSIPEDSNLAMPGEHNRLNAALAFEALKAVSLEEEQIFDGLVSFNGVEGRLQLARNIGGLKIYNDNNATTPQATVAGLEAVAEGDKKVVLIVGGSDKALAVGDLPDAIEEFCSHVILYSGTGTEKLKAELPSDVSTEEHDTLKACVEAAFATALPENVILFSPGYSSFGKEYKNEYDRNDQFMELVNTYADS